MTPDSSVDGEAVDAASPPPSRWAAIVADLRALIPYAVAFVLFVAFGVADPRFMLNWSPGIVLLLVVAWLIPALWRRWRSR